MTPLPRDLDYLATLAHARHGQRAEALRLESLARARTPEALSSALCPGAKPSGARELQRRLALEWALEVEELARGLDGPRARLLQVMASRIDVEDGKVLVRGLGAGVPAAALATHLLRPATAATVGSVRGAEDVLPSPTPARPVRRAAAPDPLAQVPRSFVLEAALDQAYFQGLVAALEGLASRERELVHALVLQEVDHFHLLLVARGRFTFGLEPGALAGWHVAGAGIGGEKLLAMLAAPDLARAATMAVGVALDERPVVPHLDARALDAAAWRR